MLYNPKTKAMEYAHRVAWEIANGRPVPDLFEGKPAVIMHRCDNRSCVTPHHLVLGNQALNQQDKKQKRRSNPSKKYRGKSLSESQLKEIYGLFDEGHSSYKIAKITGYSQPHIGFIRKKYKEQRHNDLLKLVEFMLSLPSRYPISA